MRIEKITLNNFGSYEGLTTFDTHCSADKNIILIGGKNGAGKTTLFTAMRICLYGYMSMGYKSQGSYYFRAITKLINNNAKITKPTRAFVQMDISLNNGQGLDLYSIKRDWIIDSSLSETLLINRNGTELNSDEIADFEKYILSLIPPELFNLYFFDGENIADFFMNEGGNSRIRDAFLTLCGYDTFEIMRRNFKRIGGGISGSGVALDEYWEAKQAVESARSRLTELETERKDCLDQIESCVSDLEALEKAYSQDGGITQEEWDLKIARMKEEEKKRDSWNATLRKWANEVIPFVMIREQISSLQDQIHAENGTQKFKDFCEVLESEEIRALLGDKIDDIQRIAEDKYGGNTPQILGLSLSQSASLLAQIESLLAFDPQNVAKCKRLIKRSINKTVAIREELEKSSVTSFQQYMEQKTALLEEKDGLLRRQISLEQGLALERDELQQAEGLLSKTQSKLEAELKKASINDISAKAIIMLDKLQAVLYQKQIEKVESFFRSEIRTLMRKTQFIDDIRIDQDFNIEIYRHEPVLIDTLQGAMEQRSIEHLEEVFGTAAVKELMSHFESASIEELVFKCSISDETEIVLPIRIDQTALSNGEKQIYIMALYHSLVSLGNQELPFIIDTPFARIDTEHRRNISTHFFSKLTGQIFILSTNEEIDSDHVQILRDRIAHTYMLENSDNKRTTVLADIYF